jgi:tight adherence protein C
MRFVDSFVASGGGVVVLVGVGVAIAVLALARALDAVLTSPDRVLARLRPAGRAGLVAAPADGPFGGALSRGLRPLATLVDPAAAQSSSALRLELTRAGYRGAHAAETFVLFKLLLALLLPAVFVVVNARLDEPLRYGYVVAVFLAAAGFYGPNAWLRSRVRRRQTAIERGLPDGLDLLVTCVEAGLGIDAALTRVARELQLSAPILAGELLLTTLELQAGLSRAEAFRRLSDRTGVEELKALAATLVQTEIFGTSLSRALRVHADGMRTRRMQRAEERAAMVAVKLTLPLVFCILPSLFVVVIGPAAVNIAKSLLPTLAGGGR